MNFKKSLITAISHTLSPGWRSVIFHRPLAFLLRLAAPRKKVALRNYGIAFPGMAKSEAQRYLNESYDHMVWTAIEAFCLSKRPSDVLGWMRVAEGGGILEEAYRAGKGAIVLTGHVGNWEILASWSAQMGYPITAIVRQPAKSGEKEIAEELRHSIGVKTLSKDAPMNRAVSLLRKGEFIGILPDQYGGPGGIQAPFFGVMTSTAPGAAIFAYLTKVPLIPVGSRRISPFKHEIYVKPPIKWEKDADRDTTIYNITKAVNESMEEMVRMAPGQWLVQHRRFRELEAR